MNFVSPDGGIQIGHPSKEKLLIMNALKTPDGTILKSTHRHDFRTHTDKINGKWYMIDGGLDYVRSSNNGDEEFLTLYNDEPHEVQRVILTWGTRGIDGDQPLTFKKICEMDTDHIEAVLETQTPREVIKTCLINELEHRKNT